MSTLPTSPTGPVTDAIDSLVCRFTPDFVLVYVNEAYARHWNRRAEDLLGIDFRTLIPKESREELTLVLRALCQESPARISEHEVIEKDGSVGWQEWMNFGVFGEDGKVVEYQAVGRDITARKQREEDLRHREKRLKHAITRTDLGVWDFNLNTGHIYYSEQWGRMLGYEARDLHPSHETWGELTHPLDAHRVEDAFTAHTRGEAPGFEEEVRMRHADGTWRWILTKGKVVEWNPDGSPGRVAGTHRDITARHAVEQALRDREQQLSTMMENIPDGICVIAGSGIVYENPSLQKLLGYEPGEMLGQNPLQFLHPDAHEVARDRIARSGAGETLEPTRYHLLPKQGEPIPVEANSGRVTIDGEPAVIALFHDLRPQEEANRKILEYQSRLRKLASEVSLTEERERRRIAAGLHDRTVQNLGLIKIRFGQLEEDVDPGKTRTDIPEFRELLDETIRETRSLMFELSPPVLYELGFPQTLDWLCEHMQEQFNVPVQFTSDNCPGDLPQDVTVVMFQAAREILMNVGKHAEAASAGLHLDCPDGCLRVAVTDDGKGFDPETIRPGRAMTGFGLFQLRERMDLLGGEVLIESAPGKGTRVTLSLCLDN